MKEKVEMDDIYFYFNLFDLLSGSFKFFHSFSKIHVSLYYIFLYLFFFVLGEINRIGKWEYYLGTD
jgi:hypothetical protein